ncbi:hypothetical protein MJD09_28045 [bacterium]|nr:hypothetical protein [bacterium]
MGYHNSGVSTGNKAVRVFLRFSLLLLAANSLANPFLPNQRQWQQDVRYQIEAELDTVSKQLNGYVRVFYRNNSPDTLTKIYLQVPANAFQDEENTAVREMRRFNIDRGSMDLPVFHDYKLTIESLQFLSIGELSRFPVQAFHFSDTILDLVLPNYLHPGDTLAMGISFKQEFVRNRADPTKTKIPTDFVNWFPRLTVYDEDGWHAEPFHFMMESFDVYSEFADMDVTLTVPGNYIVIGSGEVVEGDPGWDTVRVDTSLDQAVYKARHDSTQKKLDRIARQNAPRRIRFRAEKLQNFTWSASPKFVYSPYDSRFPIHFFYSGAGGKSSLQEAVEKFDKAFSHLEDHFGLYPYPHLSIVMNSNRPMADPMLARLGEAGHFDLSYELSSIYFPGIVGTNGVEESWLAKGIQVYMGKSLMEVIHGKRGYSREKAQEEMNWFEKQYPMPTLDDLLRNLARFYMESGQNEAISKPIHKYKDPVGALSNLYLKSEIFFEMLRYVVGDSLFKESLHETVRRHQFTHIKEDELKITFEDVSKQDLGWFFQQWLHGTPTVDYKKDEVRQYQREDKTWVTEIEVQRKGDGIMPVDVQAEIGDEAVVKRWDGKEKSGTVIFESSEKPKKISVDPEDRIMDSNPLNNQRTRLELRPDLPLLKFIHMPADAILVLWRPEIGYNKHDSVRLGFRANTSYRAFYHNLLLEGVIGVGSGELDGKIAYSHPLNRKSLMNRYHVMGRKNEGRFEAQAHIEFHGSSGILTRSGRSLELGVNFNGLLNDVYTFRNVANDTGKVRLDGWEDRDVLLAYAEGNWQFGVGRLNHKGRIRIESALPAEDVQFTKLTGRFVGEYRTLGMTARVRNNLATSFGPDALPLQHQFRGEGATPWERFHHDILKTGDALGAFDRRHVDGGGYLRGYAGQPLPAERYATVNFELELSRSVIVFKPFGFLDHGSIWSRRGDPSFTRSDAGLGIKVFGDGVNLLGGNLSLFSNLSAKVYFPIWLSDPLPGKKKTRFRWYLTLGKSL